MGIARGLPFVHKMTTAQIRERVATFGRAAAFMKSVGFDAIEIHFGHGYGISQFISPITNHRHDDYGGSLRNRMRFPLELLEAVRGAVGADFPLLGKISMSDGVRGGVNYEDSLHVAALLDVAGIDALICSDGTSSMNPMLLFHGDSILPGLLQHEKSFIMRMAMRVAGPKMFRNYPYRDLYLMEKAKRIRDRVQCQMCYVGGASTNDNIRTLLAAGFDFIQLGRGLLFDPDFAKNARANISYANGCTHCNACATLIESDQGVRCVLT
jgi:2,4-dienoyl-CoA reductase-like NADH-dependent reductase (Old Yellow Enzyme family)